MCPPYYVAFWLPAEAGCGQQAARDLSNGWRPGRALRQWGRQPFPVSSTSADYSEQKAKLKPSRVDKHAQRVDALPHDSLSRSASRFWYWHYRRPALPDRSGGGCLGGASWLAQPSRYLAVVPGVDGCRGDLHDSGGGRACDGSASVNARAHEGTWLDCADTPGRTLGCSRGPGRRVIGRCRSVSRCSRWGDRSVCGVSGAHRASARAQSSGHCHCGARGLRRGCWRSVHRHPILI